MRIGTLDWNQPFKDTKKNEKSAPAAAPSNPMIASPSDSTSNSSVSPNGAAPNGVPQNVAAPAAAATGAPGSGSIGAPGSGVPGAGATRGGRTVMWKGKTLNMDTTRSALLQAAQEEQRVAQAEATASVTNGAAPMDAGTQALHEHIATILTGMNEMCGGLQEIYGTVSKIADRDSNSERVFNTLHAELSDYKKDFIYEHLKPVIRPLLFLYDSLEQFEGETQRFGEALPTSPATSSTQSAPTPGMMPTRAVRQNTVYFREQLVEALRICEVTPMETPEGAFNARFHKAVKTTPVAPELDGQIQSVVRSGWFLNGQLLRAAEVVVGKAK